MPDRVSNLIILNDWAINFCKKFQENFIPYMTSKFYPNLSHEITDDISLSKVKGNYEILTAVSYKIYMRQSLYDILYKERKGQENIHRHTVIENVSYSPKYVAEIGEFIFGEMSYNCGISLISAVFLNNRVRNFGLGHYLLHYLELFSFEYLDYSSIICTTSSMNSEMNRLLHKTGWKNIGENIRNKNGGNTLYIWQKIKEGIAIKPKFGES